jgi:hypothetical protein
MTREHRLVVGLDDLTAVIIACRCGLRISMSPDKVYVPGQCPNADCGTAWSGKPSHQISTDHDKWASANLDLIDAIKRIRANQNNGGFKVLLEFEENAT